MIPKYLERSIAGPGLLVFKEKHGTRYFVCNTREDYCKAALHVLRGRIKDNWYYDDEADKAMTLAMAIVKAKNAESAYVFLHQRSDYEYENMTHEKAESY